MTIHQFSEDICGICYKFELHNGCSKVDNDNDDGDSDYEEDDEKDEDDDDSDEEEEDKEDDVPGLTYSGDDVEEDEEGEDSFTSEERLHTELVAKLSQHLTQSQSMRLLVQLKQRKPRNVQQIKLLSL